VNTITIHGTIQFVSRPKSVGLSKSVSKAHGHTVPRPNKPKRNVLSDRLNWP